MTIPELEEAEYFKEPFDVKVFIENLVSQNVLKYKKADEKYSAKVEEVFDKKHQQLMILNEKITEITNEFFEKFNDTQKECINRVELLNAALNNTGDSLNEFLADVRGLGRHMNRFGKGIAIHDLAITRAGDLIFLFQKFDSFSSSDSADVAGFNDITHILTNFQTLQSLKKVSQIIEVEKYKPTCDRINVTYDQIERHIKAQLITAYENMKFDIIKIIVASIINNETMHVIYMLFIEYFQKANKSENLVDSQIDSFKKFSDLCNEVFASSQKIILKIYLQKLYEGPLKGYCDAHLSDTEPEFLDSLYSVYKRIFGMEDKFKRINHNIDVSVFEYLRKLLFSQYLSKYFSAEIEYLTSSFSKVITNLQNDKSGNIFLQEVGVNMVQMTKKSQNRCELLSSINNYPTNTSKIYEILVNQLILGVCMNEIDNYQKEISSNSIKYGFDIKLFELIDQINAVVHLIEKYYSQFVLPAISSSVYYKKTSQFLKNSLASLEVKIDICIDKYINICIASVKSTISSQMNLKEILYSGQNTILSEDVSTACSSLRKLNAGIKSRIDFQNFQKFGFEFCIRLTRFLVQFYKNFNYSVEGAMIALWDIREFKSSFSMYKIKEIDEIFDTIHSLLNVLVVSPNDVKTFSLTINLKKVDPQLIQAYVEKRMDYKQSKIGRVDR
uniref:Exocyst complex component 5 (Trinotate prediction) n=1 Tax=Myxobolus squamalis TaxID=59785 RepID=A0A6B2FVZ9_MYXSQ